MPNPLHMTLLLRQTKPCDLSCFKNIFLAGARVHRDLIVELRKRTDGNVMEFYGQSELLMPVFEASPLAPLGSVGKKYPFNIIKLVDPETQEEVTEPNKSGELWVKNVLFKILPIEMEEVIRSHPAVSDVIALGIPDPDGVVGELPVACVRTKPSCSVSATEIKRLVQDKLSVNKQLYGGVIFLDKFPLTNTGKVALAKLKQIAMDAKKE